MRMLVKKRMLFFFSLFVFVLFSCINPGDSNFEFLENTNTTEFVPTPTFTFLSPTNTPTFTSTSLPTLTATNIPTKTATPFPEPSGCSRPPDDMTIIEINGHKLNQRTYSMLLHAAELYGGPIDIAGSAITQGSYTSSEPLSFGTHAGGGAVDISIIDKSSGNWVVLSDEVEPLIYSLRVAGFAAWLREYGELKPGSPIHIHAIAIGDPELSPNAAEQLTGKYGYFRGFTGIPQENGIPVEDRYGGPQVCKWMWEMGYMDLLQTP